MSNSMNAAQDLKHIASKFRGILEVADLLERIGSLEQAERDAIIRKDLAYKEANEADLTIDSKKQELAEIEKAKAKTQLEVETMISEGKKKYDEVVSNALSQRDEILAKAQNRKLEIAQEAQALMDDMSKTKKELEIKKDELSFIQEQLKEAKRKIAAFGTE